VVTHSLATDAIRDRASLYALGGLAGDARHEFEAHLDECEVCRTEAAAFTEIAADLALNAPPRPPSPGLRERLLDAARVPHAAAAVAPLFAFTLANEGTWHELMPGVFRKHLGGPSGSPGFLFRIEPGAAIVPHTHAKAEHCFVVEGEVDIAGRHLRAGDYSCAMPGSTHTETRSAGGCVLLIIDAPV
jgi:anti-sigma factor ChrR (cupin superfamily)